MELVSERGVLFRDTGSEPEQKAEETKNVSIDRKDKGLWSIVHFS